MASTSKASTQQASTGCGLLCAQLTVYGAHAGSSPQQQGHHTLLQSVLTARPNLLVGLSALQRWSDTPPLSRWSHNTTVLRLSLLCLCLCLSPRVWQNSPLS